jgi:Protein of unknown function (DUF3892)
MPRHYAVEVVRDDPGALRNSLQVIARGGGRVVSVTWQPARSLSRPDLGAYAVPSGYTVISEYDSPDATRTYIGSAALPQSRAMAEEREITCINKQPRRNPYDAITHVGGGTMLGSWKFTRQEAISLIESGRMKFFVREPKGRRTEVRVHLSSMFGNKYLKTDADESEPNNLLNLPECE